MIGSAHFDSLCELIEYYQKKPLYKHFKLKYVVNSGKFLTWYPIPYSLIESKLSCEHFIMQSRILKGPLVALGATRWVRIT